MAAWETLSAEEQALVQNFVDVLLRPWCGEQARTNNHGDAADTDYNAQISALLSQLDGSVEIPNGSGLAGAASLTKDEVVSIVSHVQGILAAYNTSAHRQLWTKAAGAVNLIG